MQDYRNQAVLWKMVTWLSMLIILGVGGSAVPAEIGDTRSRKPTSDKSPNVLFIAIDDLRPELGSFGVSYAPTPHLDRLAQQACRIRAVSSRHA